MDEKQSLTFIQIRFLFTIIFQIHQHCDEICWPTQSLVELGPLVLTSTVDLLPLIGSRETCTICPCREPLDLSLMRPCLGGRGGSHVACLNFKTSHLVSGFKNACRLLTALPSLWQFGRGRFSLVAILFYALSLLFGPHGLSEFTLAGSLKWSCTIDTIKLPSVPHNFCITCSNCNSD